jgi:hypothetical protein
MKPSDKLLDRLRKGFPDLFSLDSKITFERTRAGRWQLSEGAWSWFYLIESKNYGFITVGGYSKITDLLKSPKLYISVECSNYVLNPESDVNPNDPELIKEK